MHHTIGGVKDLRTRFARGLFLGIFLALLPIATFGHAMLVRSAPDSNAKLSESPKLVELWFSEALEPGLNTIEVKDAAGQRVDRGEVTLSEENKKAQVELQELRPGVYTVNWKALSADQHAMRGTFNFTTAASGGSATATPNFIPTPTADPAHPQEQMAPYVSAAQDSGDRIVWWRTLVRWLSYASMLLIFGGFAFRSLVLVPALRRALESDERSKAIAVGTKRVVGLLWLGVLLLALASVVALFLQASDVFDTSFAGSLSPAVLTQVLATGYGSSWLLQAGSLVAIIVILLLLFKQVKRQPEREHSVLWWLGLLVGAVLLVAPSWTGHAMVSREHFRLAVITDWLHLLAGGFWVGGLFHIALTWRPVLSTIPKDHQPSALHLLIRLFTRTAMPSVVLLLLAGLYNTWAHVPSLRSLWVTPYGQALLVKLSLVLLMLVLGGINNYHFGKRAARLALKQETAEKNPVVPTERSFYRSVAFEASLGLVVLLVTAVLVFLTPARNHPAMDKVGGLETESQR